MAPNDTKRPQCGVIPKQEKSEKKDEQSRKDPELPHDYRCNQEWHKRADIDKSRREFNWKVVEPYDGDSSNEWISWDYLGLKVKDDKHKLTWRNCCDLSHAWTGLVTLTPGQAEPYHRHTTPMFYYILQGHPIITLNGIKNRTKKWQCITIPSECPHAIDNDSEDEDVIILWNYVSLTDKVNPDENYNWVWLEDIGLEKK